MTNHSRDEVRRQLRGAEQAHAAAMGPWREALRRVFSPDSEVPTEAKAQLLGVPTRRGFLKIGGVTVVGAAVLAACGSEPTPTVAESGVRGDATTTTADPAAADADTSLLLTATSLEILLVSMYQQALDSGILTTDDVVQAATLFRDQHDSHTGALQRATDDYTGVTDSGYTEPNSFLQENVVDPAVAAWTDEQSVLDLALTLETMAAETYTWSAGELSTTTLRQAVMGIGGIEARHMAVIRGLQDDEQVPDAFLPVDDRMPEASFIDVSDTTTTTAAGGSGGDTTTTTVGDTTTTSSGGSTTTTTTAG